MNNLSPASPPISATLLSKGKHTIGHETNLCRAPIWHTRPHSTDEDTVVSPVLFGHPFRKVEGHCVTTTDQRLFAQLTTTYVRSGCPDSRQVPFSLGDAATTIGHDVLGGRQRSLIRSPLGRLRSVTFESAMRHPDGNQTVLGWGLIDGYLVTTRGGGKGWVKLSETVAHLLKEGSVTFLHAPTWEAICADDELAGRLWSFVESENIGSGWRYSLVTPDPTPGKAPSSMPSIAQVLQLNWNSRPRRVAQRVREACLAIERHDRRYRLSLAPGSQAGTWVLTCMRNQTKRRDSTTSMPEALIQAWRQAYRRHLPSPRQRSVLIELLSRRSVEWIVASLDGAPDGTDPFGYVLERDRTLSARDLHAAKVAEARWEEEKQRESTTGEQSILELLGSVAKHFGQSE